MRAIRHSTVRRSGALLLAIGLVAGLAATPAAVLGASIIAVNTTANAFVDDGNCTLREAIFAANNDLASGVTNGECIAGSGGDSIRFDVAGTISLTAGSELQAIIQPLTIDGGGGIEIDGGGLVSIGFCVCNTSATIRNLTVTGITGDAIAVIGSASLSNVDVSASGRGISVSAGSTLSVTDSSIIGNSTVTGAGITLNEGSTGPFVRTTIADNGADAEGGGIRMVGATVTIDQSTVSNNHAGDGGGIYMESPTGASTLKIYNSTISDNTALDEGAGIYRQGNIDIRNTTIARNTAETSGGGVETDGTGWTLQLKNSAILGNTANGFASDWANGLAGELAANAVSSLVGLACKTLGDYFSPSTLADNGGPTKTLKPKLVAGNALIDGGNATVCASAPISGKDQRGFGRLNPCDIGAVDVDRTKPVVSGVKTSLRQGLQLSGSSSLGRVTWSASDSGSGVKQYTVQRRVDGGSWSTLATGLTTAAFNVTLSRTHDYAFRVRAIDKEGNVGTFANSATFEARLYQQTSSAFAYGGSWATSTADVFSGGSTRRSTTSGSSTRFTATGRSFAWITTTGPTRGKAKIYVNGTLVATIDLFSATTTYRVQAWTRSYSSSVSKTIRIVVSGSGERVDLDAFAVLR